MQSGSAATRGVADLILLNDSFGALVPAFREGQRIVFGMGDILRVAGTAEFAGMREGISSERTDYLIGLTRQIFPEFAETIQRDEIDPWGGLRPLSADGLPMIGSTDKKGVYVNTGHGGLGWTQAAGSGRAIADHIVGAKDAFDLSDFSPLRFQ